MLGWLLLLILVDFTAASRECIGACVLAFWFEFVIKETDCILGMRPGRTWIGHPAHSVHHDTFCEEIGQSDRVIGNTVLALVGFYLGRSSNPRHTFNPWCLGIELNRGTVLFFYSTT